MVDNGWTVQRLGDLAEVLSGGTPSKSRAEYWGGNIPWVSAKDMKSFHLHDAQDHLTTLGASNGTRLVDPGAILVLFRGMTLHNDLPICIVSRTMAFNQDVKALVTKGGVHGKWLAYWLLANKPYLLSLVDSASHGTGRFHTHVFRDLLLTVPPPPEQERIADILGTLDDKIELNRRMNETLEAMARRLFKSWFVDFDPVRRNAAKLEGRSSKDENSDTSHFSLQTSHFDQLFPDSFEDSTLGPIPKGWNVSAFEEIAIIDKTSVNPDNFQDEVFDHYSIPSFDDGKTAVKEAGDRIKSNKFVVTDDCVLLTKLNPRIPRVWLPFPTSSRRSVCSTEFLVLRPKPATEKEYLFSLVSSRAFFEVYETMVTGTSGSHQRVKPEYLLSMSVLKPSRDIQVAYSKQANSIYSHMERLRIEAATLAGTRDKLLPKLLSGEIVVSKEGA